MSARLICWFFAALLLLPAASAWGQPAELPVADNLFRTWWHAQRAVMEQLDTLSFEEEIDNVIDGAHGAQARHLLTQVSSTPRTGSAWQRQYLKITVNGEPRSEAEWTEMQRRQAGRMGRDLVRLLQMPLLPVRMAGRMEIEGDTQAETLDGQAFWRIELIPTSPQPFVERMSMWFDQATGRLHHMRAFLHVDGSLIAKVDFDRIGGLDVPVHRRIEGTVRTKLRTRVFTYQYTLDGTYRAYSFSPTHTN